MNLIVMIFEVDDTKRSNPSPKKCSLVFGVWNQHQTLDARLYNYKVAITGLLHLWPDVPMEDPLLVKDGGREACWVG